MSYLYGDSSESGLDLNYIELLREFLDFGAQVLMSEHRIAGLEKAGEDQRREAELELERLRALSQSVEQALDGARREPGGAAEQCAASIRSLATEALRSAAERIKASVAEEKRQIAQKTQRERGGNVRLLERLLREHHLPDEKIQLDLELDEAAGRYEARVSGRAPQSLEWVFSVEIPSDNLFRSAIKLGDIDDKLEIQVPEKSGLVRKSMKLRPHRLGNLYLIERRRAFEQTTLTLRATPHRDDSGFDITFSKSAPRVRLVKIAKDGENSPPFEPLDEDADKLIELCAVIDRHAESLIDHRNTLVEARFESKPLGSHDNPAALVRRLVDRLGPVIQEIGQRSLAPGELVLKRVLAGDRREEIFCAKSDLLAKLTPVPKSMREVFAPLGLGPVSGDDDATTELVISSTDPGDPAAVRSGSIGGDDEEEETVVASRPSEPSPGPRPKAVGTRASELLAELAPPKLPKPKPKTKTAPKVPAAPKPPPGVAALEKPAATPKSPTVPPPVPASPAKLENGASKEDSVDVALAELETENREVGPKLS